MQPLRALVIYVIVVFVGGALLAPWLYWSAQALAHLFPRIAAEPFNRFVDRSLLIVALAGLWPLLRSLRVTSWHELGLVRLHGQWKKLLGGLVIGFLSLAVVAGIAMIYGNRILIRTETAHQVVAILFKAAGTAAIVAVMEEILFRGGIFGGLRKFFYWPLALVISSIIYALTHFLRRTEFNGTVSWHSGLVLLPRMLGGFVDFYTLVPDFLNLTLAGILLGLAYQRTGNLYFSIGLHGGWVFWLKTYGALTTALPHAATWFWGTSKMIDGWLALIVLVGVLVFFKFLPWHRKSEPFAIP
ncbi:MAG TPA: CPBP family intramembrane glutamic endopeptidase [Candidatus Saccharimonadales bacterium]|nr:CPBP family intramembrane glutamic endopeptidase [Candidatus Saccharimonadales bacterium]